MLAKAVARTGRKAGQQFALPVPNRHLLIALNNARYVPNAQGAEATKAVFQENSAVRALLRNLWPIQNGLRRLLYWVRSAPRLVALIIDRSFSDHRARLIAEI